MAQQNSLYKRPHSNSTFQPCGIGCHILGPCHIACLSTTLSTTTCFEWDYTKAQRLARAGQLRMTAQNPLATGLFLSYTYCIYFSAELDSFICLRVLYICLMQVLEVWHMTGHIRLYMLCCRYVSEKVNCLLYIIHFFLEAGYLSMRISIHRFSSA